MIAGKKSLPFPSTREGEGQDELGGYKTASTRLPRFARNDNSGVSLRVPACRDEAIPAQNREGKDSFTPRNLAPPLKVIGSRGSYEKLPLLK